MRKEPLFFPIARFLLLLSLVGVLILLYWSSLLIEGDLKALKQQIQNLKGEALSLTAGDSAPKREVVHSKEPRPHIREDLPNLLQNDPFYEKTLPKLLGDSFNPSGIRQEASTGKPDNLHPLSNWAQVADWQQRCSISVSRNKFGFFEAYCPYAAFKVEERIIEGGVEYWVHLRDDIVWQPLQKHFFEGRIDLASHFLKKHPVTAHDFKFQYDVIVNPFITESKAVALRQYFEDIEEFRVIDDFTFAVRWKAHPVELADGSKVFRPKYLAKSITLGFSPLARFVYQYYPDGKKIVEDDADSKTYQRNSSFAQQFTVHWAKNIIPSCGRMRFEGMNDEAIRFSRNPDHFDPLDCLVEGLYIAFKQSEDNVWQAFKQGSIDSYSIQPGRLLEFKQFLNADIYKAQMEKGLEIHELKYSSRAYSYIGWNEAHPLFESKRVRQALTMAIDRPRIISQILNGMGKELSCPFYPYSNAYDNSIKPWPFDPAKARRILEEEGFMDFEGKGILSKKIGNSLLHFEFSLTYYVKNPTTKAICEYVATALKEIGIKCNLNGVDIADLSALFDDKSFDAYLLAWSLGDPPEDLRQLWHSSGAKEKGSSNAIGFANSKVDEIIEALTYEYETRKRTELYHLFDAIFHEEAPYTLLYAPKISFAYRDYLQNVFLPVDRQDLVPGATRAEPDPEIFWLKPLPHRSF